MSSEGAPPPDDGSSPAKDQPTNPPKTEPKPTPPAETKPKPTEPVPAAAAQTPPAPGVMPVTPAAVAGTTPVVPGQPGAPGIPALTPPPPHRKKPSPAKHKSNGEDTDKGLLIGVVAGAVLLLLFIVALICCACCSKKKKKKTKQQQFGGPDHMQYYVSGGPNGGQYYSNHPPLQKKWQSPEHSLHIPPPMGVPGGTWGSHFSPSPGLPVGGHSADISSTLSSPGSHGMVPPPPPSLGFNKNAFTYDELAAATSGFAQSNILGQGGFGYVHKGVLPNGKEIAVKSLKSGSGQGEREFQAEVEIISRVHHRHLVSLVGYCIAGGQRMLVYEFVPNNNLEFHLHGKGRPPIEWGMRMKIAMGSAKGLAYLHEDCHPRIIHRDIKTANILLDFSFEAKVADFGLAKLSSDKYTHVSTRIMGTFGYLAPEYASSGKLTEKSDVYSFGVMMLELITGRRPIDMTGQMDESLVDWARPLLQRAMEDGNYEPFVDPHLEKRFMPHEMKRMVACAASSIRHSARRRPKMSQIVRALEGDVSLDDLNDGVKPGQSTAFTSSGDSDEGATTTTYSAQMRKFRKMALETDEYSSSEYGATSEYGLNPSASSDSSESKSSVNQTPPKPIH